MAVLKEARNVKYGHVRRAGQLPAGRGRAAEGDRRRREFKAAGTRQRRRRRCRRGSSWRTSTSRDKQPELAELDAAADEHNRAALERAARTGTRSPSDRDH